MPTRNERLADHYLRAAGIVGVYVEAGQGGARVDWLPVVTIEQPPGRVVVCCARPTYATHLVGMVAPAIEADMDVTDAATALLSIARVEGIGLTPHARVVARAMEAVATVNAELEKMRHNGGLRALNRQFKAGRGRGGIGLYADFLHAKKAEMLDVIATGGKIIFSRSGERR